jgi:hypothetical protein
MLTYSKLSFVDSSILYDFAISLQHTIFVTDIKIFDRLVVPYTHNYKYTRKHARLVASTAFSTPDRPSQCEVFT